MGLTAYTITPSLTNTDLTNIDLGIVNFSYTALTGNITMGVITTDYGLTVIASAGSVTSNGDVYTNTHLIADKGLVTLHLLVPAIT